MDARLTRYACLAGALGLFLADATTVAAPPGRLVSLRRPGAYRTENFVVRAPTAELAREIGDSAEQWREKLAIEWIGRPMPKWVEPCKLSAKVSPQLGAGGATTFVFDRGEVFGWDMEVQGSRERILDSVLPHEVTHTVFASYFRKPLPRWADEGACTTVEHRSEIAKQERLLIQFLKTDRGIPFSRMFAMKEYPRDILPLYSQGHSLCQFLIEKHGKKEFLAFLTDGMRDENWRRAVQQHYGQENLYVLQTEWLDWVKSGRPQLDIEPGEAIASADTVTPVPASRPSPPATTVAAATPARPSVYAPVSVEAPTRSSVYDASRGTAAVWR